MEEKKKRRKEGKEAEEWEAKDLGMEKKRVLTKHAKLKRVIVLPTVKE